MDNAELINKMVDDIIAGNNGEALDSFNAAMGGKVSSALDAKKIELAQSIYDKSKVENDAEETTTDDSAV